MTIQHAISDEQQECFVCKTKGIPCQIDAGEPFVKVEMDGKEATACLDCYHKFEQEVERL